MYNFRARSDAAKLFFDEPTMTKQDFAAECDINNILKKYKKANVNPFVIAQGAKYGDFSDLPSYQDALDYTIAAQQSFDGLSAQIRKRFRNDPAELLDFLSDQSNHDEAVRLGLVKPPQLPQIA